MLLLSVSFLLFSLTGSVDHFTPPCARNLHHAWLDHSTPVDHFTPPCARNLHHAWLDHSTPVDHFTPPCARNLHHAWLNASPLNLSFRMAVVDIGCCACNLHHA